MAIALVSNVKVAGPGNITSAAIDTTGANFIVISVTQNADGGYTISDSKSNTWTPLTAYASDTPDQRFYYAWNPTVGSGHTFTGTGGTFGVLNVAAFSGVKISADPFDAIAGRSGGGFTGGVNAEADSAITPAEDNELIVAGIAGSFVAALTINSGMTITDQVATVGGNNYGSGLAYKVQTTAAAINPMWDVGPGAAFAGGLAIACFKAAPAGTITREQEGYRFRADDGSESTATWLASQDTNISRAKSLNTRLRLLTNVTNDAPSEGLKLQYRRANGADEWKDVD